MSFIISNYCLMSERVGSFPEIRSPSNRAICKRHVCSAEHTLWTNKSQISTPQAICLRRLLFWPYLMRQNRLSFAWVKYNVQYHKYLYNLYLTGQSENEESIDCIKLRIAFTMNFFIHWKREQKCMLKDSS
jgi:hypothetical protein